jgi:hypothetical protein
MNTLKEQLIRWIDEDREQIIGFLCDFVRAKSPNPPGDTTRSAAHVASFLEAHQLPFRVIAPQPTMPNIVGSFAGADAWSSSGAQRPYGRVPSRRAARALDTRTVEWGDRGRQDLRPRRG